MSTFLKLTRERTENKRQEVAAELLAWEKITDEIGQAAAAGRSKIVLTPAAPIKIRHTAVAIDVVARLTKAEFRPTWSDDPRAPAGVVGDQLEIEW